MSTGVLTPAQRTLRARVAAFALHAQRDPLETTAAARAKFLASFVDLVDPDRVLPEAERLRRAESARKAHYARMAFARSRNQSAKKQSKTAEPRENSTASMNASAGGARRVSSSDQQSQPG